MTPGWAEVGIDMVIKELHLDRAIKYGKNPLDMANGSLPTTDVEFSSIPTLAIPTIFLARAKAFCEDFNITLEETATDSKILERSIPAVQEYLPPKKMPEARTVEISA